MENLMMKMPGPVRDQMAKSAANQEVKKLQGVPGWRIVFDDSCSNIVWQVLWICLIRFLVFNSDPVTCTAGLGHWLYQFLWLHYIILDVTILCILIACVSFPAATAIKGLATFGLAIYALYLYIVGFIDYYGFEGPVKCTSADASVVNHAENLIVTHIVFGWIAFVVMGLACCCACIAVCASLAK